GTKHHLGGIKHHPITINPSPLDRLLTLRLSNLEASPAYVWKQRVEQNITHVMARR
ncbi:hypothetical protein ACLOJK_029646, partial [Asimina triloba]